MCGSEISSAKNRENSDTENFRCLRVIQKIAVKKQRVAVSGFFRKSPAESLDTDAEFEPDRTGREIVGWAKRNVEERRTIN